MKLKHFLLLLFGVSLFGCGDPGGLETHFIYGNATDKNITVEVFERDLRDTTNTIIRRDTSFVIAPGNEFSLSFYGGGILGIGNPFSFHGSLLGCFLTYSNGEVTITQEAFQKYDNPLFSRSTYEKNSETEYKYVFTDKDFEVQEIK